METTNKKAATKKSTTKKAVAKKAAAPRRPIRELFLDAAKGGKFVPVAKVRAVAKKAGANFENRFYWFKKSGAKKLGYKVIMSEDGDKFKLVHVGGGASKKAAKKVAAKKPAAPKAVVHKPAETPAVAA